MVWMQIKVMTSDGIHMSFLIKLKVEPDHLLTINFIIIYRMFIVKYKNIMILDNIHKISVMKLI